MTIKQNFLKLIYPALMLAGKKGAGKKNVTNTKAPVSIYPLSFLLNSGEKICMEKYAGKKILIVNTASNCGFTGQYAELQKLQQQYAEKLVVIGFPANDFQEQEKGTDVEIASFCKINYGINFPLAQKSSVLKGINQNEIFEWLGNKEKNGWCHTAPNWNFCKYLINEEGMLIGFYASTVSPLSNEIVKYIE